VREQLFLANGIKGLRGARGALGRHGGQKCGIVTHICLELHVDVCALERGSGTCGAAALTVK